MRENKNQELRLPLDRVSVRQQAKSLDDLPGVPLSGRLTCALRIADRTKPVCGP